MMLWTFFFMHAFALIRNSDVFLKLVAMHNESLPLLPSQLFTFDVHLILSRLHNNL